MPLYVYECDKCEDQHHETHTMQEDPKIKCPKCGGPCFRAIQPVQGYVRGNCYLNKKDCKQQSQLALIKDDDPYKQHRVPGEAEDLVNKVKRGDRKKKIVPISGLKKS